MLRPFAASVFLIMTTAIAAAAPARIVILTSAEAADAWQLCEVGSQRAQGLRYNYLGAKAAKTFFSEEEPPAFFFRRRPAHSGHGDARLVELAEAHHPLLSVAAGR